MTVTYYGPGNPKERFQHFLEHPPSTIAFDVETISIKERMPLGFALAFSPHEAIYFQVHPEVPPELTLLKPLLKNIRVTKAAHNIMFDLGVMPLIPEMEGLDRSNIWDTNLAARLLGRTDTDLETLALTEDLMNPVKSVKSMLKSGQTMLDLDPASVANKCQRDARACFELYLNYKPEIMGKYPGYFNTEMESIPIILDMSMRGTIIDQRARAKLQSELEEELEFYRRILEEAGISKPGSAQQVGYILGKRGNFLPFTRSKRQLSTKESDIEFLDDPLAAAILAWRSKSKLLSTYIIPMGVEARFYTEYYNETGVGRLNSKNRNIQNIPPNCRVMLLPDSGTFTSADYSREHLYILAHMSQDRDMLRVLYDPDPKKADIHQHTADIMRVPRHLAKTLNFAVVYGATAKTISEQAKIKDMGLCNRLIDGWFRAYPGAADWITYAQRVGVNDGWSLPTLFGRRIAIPEETNKWGKRDFDAARRKSVNYPILGSDGEVIKRAMILCRNRGLGPPTMAITVHDSLTFDGDFQLPVEELEHIPGFRIPIEVKKTFTWE